MPYYYTMTAADASEVLQGAEIRRPLSPAEAAALLTTDEDGYADEEGDTYFLESCRIEREDYVRALRVAGILY